MTVQSFLFRESFEGKVIAFLARIKSTMTSADFLLQLLGGRISPGKDIFLPPMPAPSTKKRLLVTDFTMMCLLILSS